MQYARIGLDGRLVAADESPLRSDYLCPLCGGRVFLRAGEIRDAHFAHYDGEGTPECKDYRPSLLATGEHSFIPDSTDARPTELDVCLDVIETRSGGDDWTLFLSLPELALPELELESFSALMCCAVDVGATGKSLTRLRALDLRPSAGGALAVVPPSEEGYSSTVVGEWPASIDSRRWIGGARGISPTGDLFRLRRGEWTRMSKGEPVREGETVLVLGDSRVTLPPDQASTVGATTSACGRMWRLWRLTVPKSATSELTAWLSSRSHQIVSPPPKLTLVSLGSRAPRDPDDSGFAFGELLFACISDLSGPTQLSVRAERQPSSDALVLQNDSLVFASIDTQTAAEGSYQLELDSIPAMEFRLQDGQSADELHARLALSPRLQVTIGTKPIAPWATSPTVARHPERGTLAVSIEARLDTARLNVVVVERKRRRIWRAISCREAERVLAEVMRRRSDVSIEVDGGALGRAAVTISGSSTRHATDLERKVTRLLAGASCQGNVGVLRSLARHVPRHSRYLRALSVTTPPSTRASAQLRALPRSIRRR